MVRLLLVPTQVSAVKQQEEEEKRDMSIGQTERAVESDGARGILEVPPTSFLGMESGFI